MALKLVITKGEFDALAEPVKQLYVADGDKYKLSIEGGAVPESEITDLKTKLGEFRDNNINYLKELDKLRPLQEKYKDVDPEEYKTLKMKAKQLEDKGVKTPDDVLAAIDAAVKPLRESLESEKKAREEAQHRADDARFRELVSADAQKAGVRPNSMRHVLREAESVFQLQDGRLVPKPGQKHPDDPLKDLSLDVWLAKLSKTDENLFGESVGGGATNGRSGGRGDVRQLVNPTPLEMGQNMEAIAKGQVVVVRTQ
jgi:hypothetical protein